MLAIVAGLLTMPAKGADAQVLRPSISAETADGEPGQADDQPTVPEESSLANDGVITDGAPEPDPANPGAVPAGDWTAAAERDTSGDLAADGQYAAPTDDPPSPQRPQTKAVDEPADPFAPVGVRLGSFEFFPEETVLGVVTGNALASARNPKADAIIEVKPSLAFRSEWKTHSLSGALNLVEDWHGSYSSEDTLGFDGSLSGRIDLTKRSNIEAEASWNEDQQGRGDIDVPDAAVSRPKADTGRTALRYNQRFNRLAVSLGIEHIATGHADTELANGTVLSRADENTFEDGVTLRAGYEWLDGYEIFGEVGASRLSYERAALSDGLKRDGNGGLVRAGVKVLTGKSIEGEGSIGWREFDPDDGRLAAIDGLVVDASLRFRPGELTTLTLSGQSDIAGTSIAGAAGALNRSTWLELRREITRSFVVIAGIGYAVKDYQGAGTREATTAVNFNLEYLLTSHWALVGGLDTTTATTESTGSPDSTITEDRVRAGLRWRM